MRQLSSVVTERNYAKEPLTEAEVKTIVDLASPLADVINTRHKLVKERGWKEKAPSKRDLVAAVLEDNNVLRRPILVHEDRLVVGKDEDAIRELLS